MVQEEMSYKAISNLELWWPFCSAGQNHLCNIDVGYQEEQFCGIIINLNQLFRRCHLKFFLSGALAALLFSGVEPFVQFWKRASWERFMWSYMKYSKWVWSGNTTITNCRQTHGTTGKHETSGRQTKQRNQLSLPKKCSARMEAF